MKTKWIITLIIVSALLGASHLAQSSAQPANADPKSDPPKLVDCSAEFIIGGMVIVVGIVVYIGLKKFCEKHLPQDPPPPPPPPPPCTNCNPAHLNWPCTNCSPVKSGLLSMPKGFTNGFSLLKLDTDSMDYEDVQSYGWTDAFGNIYTIHFRCAVECSSNMTVWVPLYRMDGFVSFGIPSQLRFPSNSVFVVSDPQGVPVCTNWSWLEQHLPMETNTAPQRFYRLVHD